MCRWLWDWILKDSGSFIDDDCHYVADLHLYRGSPSNRSKHFLPRLDMLTLCNAPIFLSNWSWPKFLWSWGDHSTNLITQVHPVPELRSPVLQRHLYAVLESCLGTKTPWPSLALSQHGLPPPKGQDLLIIETSRSHRVTHTTFRSDSSRQVISPKQRLLLDNTQHSQQTSSHAPGGIRARNPSKWADRAATRIGHSVCIHYLTDTQLFHSENISTDVTYDILAQSVLGFNAKSPISDTPN